MNLQTKESERESLDNNIMTNEAIIHNIDLKQGKDEPKLKPILKKKDENNKLIILPHNAKKKSTLDVPILELPRENNFKRSKTELEEILNKYKQEGNRSAKQLWNKLKSIVKGVISFQKVSKNLNLYGISEENIENYKYISNLKRIQSLFEDKEDNLKQGKKRKYICKPIPLIYPEYSFSIYWNVLIGMMMLHGVTITPYKLAFVDYKEFISDTIDDIINYFFILDIIINFNTVITINSNYETSRIKIAYNYLTSWFLLDLLASFPLNLILETDTGINDGNKIIRLSRFSKLSKLSRIFRILKVSRFFRRVSFINAIQDFLNINYGISRLITFILSFVVVCHIVACMWYFIPTLYDEYYNWTITKHLVDESNFRKYIICLYWTFTTITTCGFGDITATNEVEYIFSLIWVGFGVFFYSFTIGTLSTILVNMNTKNNLLAQKLNIINTYCKLTNLSDEVNNEMKRLIVFKSNTNLFSWIEKQDIFNNLPANIKCEVS